jgi:serine/threonine protein phosphatase PrpC
VAELAASVHEAPACTYVSAIVGPDRVTVGWVGDSRAYWLPDDGPAIVLTQDDVASPGVLNAWLGADADEVVARTRDFAPPAAGVLLICSDGLWGYLPHPRSLRAALSSGASLDSARGLVRHALDAGGRDNITVVLIPVAGPGLGAQQTGIDSPTSPMYRPSRRLT